MRRYKTLLVLLTVMMSAMRIMAQEVSITVTTTQQILPPQILLYLTDPGKFFNVSISNTSSEDQYVYLGLQLEHLSPNDGLSIATPPQYQPNAPFIIPAGGSYNLTTVDMMNLFNHIPASAMQIPDGLMDGYQNGSFGLLPEGTYEVRFQAYQWKMPKYAEPVACSHPMSGRNTFQVCYNASAPTFLTPFIGLGLNDLTKLIYKGRKLYEECAQAIEQDCTDDEFMALYEQYPDFDDLDDEFVTQEEGFTEAVARYVDEHIDAFATVLK